MKDYVLLTTRKSIHAFLREHWQTKEFRDSHDEKGYVYRWVERFADYPRMFGTMTDARLEKAHFSPWWNVVGMRDYTGALFDLWLLHEIAHMATMLYDATLAWPAWAAKMADNEMLASLESETLVYLALPTLREQSFPGEIWADRFLGGSGPRDPVVSADHRSFMLMQRYLARLRPEDDLEQRIAEFRHENTAWAGIWRRHHRDVETQMMAFRRLAAKGQRRQALDAHLRWLERLSDDGIPFRHEAERFAEVYWRTRGG